MSDCWNPVFSLYLLNSYWIMSLSTLSWQQAKTKENIKLHVQLWTALLNCALQYSYLCTFFYFLLQVRDCQSHFVLFFQSKLSVQILNLHLNLHLHTLKQLTYSIHPHKSIFFHLNMQKFSPFSFKMHNLALTHASNDDLLFCFLICFCFFALQKKQFAGLWSLNFWDIRHIRTYYCKWVSSIPTISIFFLKKGTK